MPSPIALPLKPQPPALVTAPLPPRFTDEEPPLLDPAWFADDLEPELPPPPPPRPPARPGAGDFRFSSGSPAPARYTRPARTAPQPLRPDYTGMACAGAVVLCLYGVLIAGVMANHQRGGQSTTPAETGLPSVQYPPAESTVEAPEESPAQVSAEDAAHQQRLDEIQRETDAYGEQLERETTAKIRQIEEERDAWIENVRAQNAAIAPEAVQEAAAAAAE